MADARSEINSLHELFYHSARTFRDNKAVTFSGDAVESVTYCDLSKKVEKLSSVFGKIFDRNEVVGIYSQDCLNLPAVLLAVMDVSAAFFPISTTIQPQKVLESINHRSLRYILVDNRLLKYILNLSEYDNTLEIIESKVLQEIGFSMLKVVNRNQPRVVNWSKNLAYVMQTSGTTGDPKAVFVPHSCIVPNILHLSSIFEVTCRDVIYLASPYTFDPFIVQMFLAFHNGAELLITTPTTKLMPEKLCQKLFDQHKVTILQPTPSLLYYIGENLISSNILSENSSLLVLAFGGESCPPLSTLRKWKHAKCKTRLYNIYGITEVSSWATCYHITDEKLNETANDHESKIFTTCELGSPLLETELIVKNDNGDLVSGNGTGIGHLQIGGKYRQCLVEGETEENVPTMRDSGDIVQIKDGHMWYLGRSDNQIKRFGNRINLDYIERTVRECTDVNSCSIVHQPVSSTGSGTLLHLCVVPNLQTERSSEDHQRYKTALCEQIKDILPGPSQPDQVHLIGKFPITSHGKVDKRKLLRIVMDRNSHYKNGLSVDVALSEMWLESIGKSLSVNIIDKESLSRRKNLLKKPVSDLSFEIPTVKSSDMFMLQGGDSLRAVYLAEQIEKWIDKQCDHPRDLSMMFEIITNEPFSSLVSYVQEILQSRASVASRSIILDQRRRPDSRRPSNTDLEAIAKMSKGRNSSADLASNRLIEKTVSVSENQTCTCFLRRGSERFVCSLCQENSACFISHYITPSRLLIKEMPLKWNVCMEKCIDASPLVVPSCLTGKGVVFIGSHSQLFMAVSLTNGEVLWRTRLGGRIESSACVSLCGKFIVVGCYDGKIYVLARNDGKIIWTYQTNDVVKSSPCLDLKNGLIWIGSHDGCLYSLDIDRKVCNMCVECKEGSCFSSPAISYDPYCVYIGTLAGCFLCVDALSGKIKWFKRFEKPIFSSPFLQEDKVFVVTVNGCLKCLSHYGDEVWELCTDVPIFSTPVGITSQIASTAGDVFLASHGNKIFRVSSEGECKWSTTVDGPSYATPCFISCNYDSTRPEISTPHPTASNSTCVVVVTTKGTVYFLAGNDGRELNTFPVPGEVFSSPVVVGRDIVLGCRNDFLYCFKL